ncbi:hypothetical protein MHBO_001794 [Bonamia ostreae]|uniref:Uncharacterized protein n=1 Tax=Bonamia ostreae TaxID=126728 RepID=A0ABV2AK78_9EUKA
MAEEEKRSGGALDDEMIFLLESINSDAHSIFQDNNDYLDTFYPPFSNKITKSEQDGTAIYSEKKRGQESESIFSSETANFNLSGIPETQSTFSTESKPDFMFKPDFIYKNVKNEKPDLQIELQKRELRAEKSRKARLRKKLHVEKLEQEVEQLQKMIKESLKRKHDPETTLNYQNRFLNPKKKKSAHFKQQKDKSIVIDVSKIKKVCEKSANSSKERLTKALYYLESVGDCLVPGNQVKFLLWIFTQKEEFYSKRLPESLFKGLDIPTEKIKKALKDRNVMKNDRDKMEFLVERLKKLQEKIKEHLVGASALANKIRSQLSSDQLMRFFRWMKATECKEIMGKISETEIFKNPVQPPLITVN